MWKVIDLEDNRRCEATYDSLESLYDEYLEDLGHEDRMIRQFDEDGNLETSIGMVAFFDRFNEFDLPDKIAPDNYDL